MKQIAQYQDGRLELQDVPLPTLPPGGALVRVTHSVVSVGTERMKVEQAKMNLIQKARARPDQVKKVLDTGRNLGWRAALEKVRNRLETPTPLGYSVAGVVEAVDPANTRLRVGDRVACGGAECAWHAEYVAVPDMLVAQVPQEVESWKAAYTTIAAIALQAVRQAAPAVGDRVLIVGQGLVGLLVTSLMRASGARVMATDLAPGRGAVATKMGAETFLSAADNVLDTVRLWTDGYGVDCVILATSTQSNAPAEQAIEMLRDRGRIVVVGNTRVDLPWKLAYEKEIELRYSRSYGPGRYDPGYEWAGIDYPIGYVRWTEQRNFDAVLHLMKSGALELTAITTRRVPFAHALSVYEELAREGSSDIGVVLEYGTGTAVPPDIPTNGLGGKVDGIPSLRAIPKLQAAAHRVDVIGAGNFARTMLLPHLKGAVHLGTVVNLTSLSARHVQQKFGFAEVATDTGAVLGDQPEAGRAAAAGVLIATRHHLHAPLVLRALAANRHVFVEKPLCLNAEELAQIDAAYGRSAGSLQVGFNRRFAPATLELRSLLQAAPGPKTVCYRVVPGKLDPHHWYANYQESGGRVVGEASHFFDFFCFLLNSRPVQVFAQTTWPPAGRTPFPDSVAAQVEFADGSCGQLVYNGGGDPTWPKEQCTAYAAGLVAELTNCQELIVRQGRKERRRSFAGKGHTEQMAAWVAFLQGAAEHPFPYWAARQSMQLTFAALRSIQQGRCVPV